MPGRKRSESVSITVDDRSKRFKSEHSPVKAVNHIASFADGLFNDPNVQELHQAYEESGPFLHVVVDELLQNNLLVKVKDECLSELSFSEKETDIYKVHQTGDLASLSYLAEAQIALLPNLLKLRDALYSNEFRTFIRNVTGCGPLSGKKQDMSVNSYKKGCHLLNHDDVIGSRRVSYILYMPTPEDQPWKPEWGGALELYPVKPGEDGQEEPECGPSKSIPPSWNQFTFFEVQPGHSFHSVEEVVVDEGDCQRQRLSISGWFHRAQEGEEGFEGEPVEQNKSSLEQLTSTRTAFSPYAEPFDDQLPSNTLTADQISFLSAFLNPSYLQPKVLKKLGERFVDESSLELHNFLAKPLAEKLEKGLREKDVSDKLDHESRKGRVPPHDAGTDNEWTMRGPPHKSRFCTLNLPASSSTSPEDNTKAALAIVASADSTPAQIMQALERTLFPSPAFRTWLYIVAVLIAEKYSVKARRFRPGLDYTLATSDNTQSILDVVLGLTPAYDNAQEEEKKGKNKATHHGSEEDEDEAAGWDRGDWGGWECYMAPHEGDEDPAVYQSGAPKKEKDHEHKANGTSNGHEHANTNGSNKNAHTEYEDADDEEDEEEDGTLLTVYPGFNRLMLALRDEGVMRFTKYVSAAAPGSVWDVSGEYEVLMTEDRGEDEDDTGE